MPSHFCKIVVGKTKTFSSFQFHSLANKAEQVHGGGSCRWDNHNTAAHGGRGGLNGNGLNLQRRFLLRPKPPEVLQQRGGEGGCPAKPHQHPGFNIYHRLSLFIIVTNKVVTTITILFLTPKGNIVSNQPSVPTKENRGTSMWMHYEDHNHPRAHLHNQNQNQHQRQMLFQQCTPRQQCCKPIMASCGCSTMDPALRNSCQKPTIAATERKSYEVFKQLCNPAPACHTPPIFSHSSRV